MAKTRNGHSSSRTHSRGGYTNIVVGGTRNTRISASARMPVAICMRAAVMTDMSGRHARPRNTHSRRSQTQLTPREQPQYGGACERPHRQSGAHRRSVAQQTSSNCRVATVAVASTAILCARMRLLSRHVVLPHSI